MTGTRPPWADKEPTETMEFALVLQQAKAMAMQAGTLTTPDVRRLAVILAYQSFNDSKALQFRPFGGIRNAHRVIVAVNMPDGKRRLMTLAHCKSQSTLWRVRLALHGLAAAIQGFPLSPDWEEGDNDVR